MTRDPEHGKHRRLFGAACVAALLLVVWAYANHFDNGFHFDDSHVIVNNLAIRSLHDVPSFFSDPLTFTARPENAVYRPLLTLSYAMDYARAGTLDPRPFHHTQFALHLLLGVGLVLLYRRVLDLGGAATSWNPWIALVAATWFCVHTANSETVNYLSSRSSLVATLSVVGSFLIYLTWPSLRRWQLHLIPMVVGAFAKPLAVVYAPLLLVFVLLFEERRSIREWFRNDAARTRALMRVAPAFVVAAAVYVLLRRMEPDSLVYAEVDRMTYGRTQLFVWLHYARLFFWPRGLTADTDLGFLAWSDPRILAGALFIALLVGAIVLLSERSWGRTPAFGLCWFALALLPTSSLIPLSEPYNEHRIFFPYVGAALAVAWAGGALLRRFGGAIPAGVLAVALLATHAAGTRQRNLVWQNDETLWADVVEKSPRNGRGLMNYGLTKMRSGRLDEALALFERAQLFTPNYPILEINLGICKSALAPDDATAERHFTRALELSPRYARGRYFYAKWLIEQGRAADAVSQLEQVVAISPGDVDASYLLMHVHAALGEDSRLAAQAARTLQRAPDDEVAGAYAAGRLPFAGTAATADELQALGLEMVGREEWLQAAAAYRRALELDDASSEAWNNLGWSLGQLGEFTRAIPCFERAEATATDGGQRARNNLAWARRQLSGAGGESP